ncbi:MAG TPA: hypothetical protein VIY27_06145, partial [Myxococcota bacterium]
MRSAGALAGALLCGALSAALLGSAFAPEARADLLRCKGPDGRTIYTDDAAVCPGAEPFEPAGSLQNVEPVAPAAKGRQQRLDAVERQRLKDQAEAGEIERWQLKKRAKEEELQSIAQRREELLDLVTWCNRGGRVVTYDEAGIKKAVRCSDVKKELKALDQQEASVRHYLQYELAEECR